VNNHHQPSIFYPPDKDDLDRLGELAEKDLLYPLSTADKELIWNNRYFLRNKPGALSKVLQSVHWTEPAIVAEAQRLLQHWGNVTPEAALQVGRNFPHCH
jgi:hypothetical protein